MRAILRAHRRASVRAVQPSSSARMASSIARGSGSMPASQELGKVRRSSAKSSVPTAGTVARTPSSGARTSPSSGPWAHSSTFSPASTPSPGGTGRWTVQVTSFEATSQPSETNCQYRLPQSA